MPKAQPDNGEISDIQFTKLLSGLILYFTYGILLRVVTTDLRFNVSYHDSAVSSPLRDSSGGFVR